LVLKENRTGLELKFFEIANKVVSELGLELYDLEWSPGSGDLCLYIMNPETKTALLDDCIKVDRAMSPYVENETWMPENLTLEVSSPGLFRHLNQVKHFEMSIDQDLTLTLNKNISEEQAPEFPKSMRNNMKIKVTLRSADADHIVIETKGIKVNLPYTQIKKANLETDINYKE
jgi:ribosome maturation factor RimP